MSILFLNIYILLYRKFYNNFTRSFNFSLNYNTCKILDEKLELILKDFYKILYEYTHSIDSYLMFLFSFIFYYFFSDANILFLYISNFFLLIGIIPKLIIFNLCFIESKFIKANYPLVYIIIKYLSCILLLLLICLLIINISKIMGIIITYIKNFLLNKLKEKFKIFKSALTKEPRDPQEPEENIFLPSKDKKINKKKADKLKNMILNKQKENSHRSLWDAGADLGSPSYKDNWHGTVNVQRVEDFSFNSQLGNIHEEFRLYDIQTKKFKKIVHNIDRKKEEFFPSESKPLFKEYIDLVNILKKNLKSLEKNLKKSQKK